MQAYIQFGSGTQGPFCTVSAAVRMYNGQLQISEGGRWLKLRHGVYDYGINNNCTGNGYYIRFGGVNTPVTYQP